MKNLTANLRTCVGIFAAIFSIQLSAQPGDIEAWVTKPDRSALFQKQSDTIRFTYRRSGRAQTIVVDDRTSYQTMEGFGFALTGGSAGHLIHMSPAARDRILKEMFGTEGGDVGFSYIRLTIGASDLNSFVFSYNDLPEGETDETLRKFDLGQDKIDVIPVMKEILAINPHIKILGSPWSAPAWMKEAYNVRGGHLRKDCYEVYALYFVKYVQEMKKQGITIDAITIQNEPLNNRNTPSMPWYPEEQEEFLSQHLIPAFRAAGLNTKLVLFDHNLDRIDYPLALLQNPVISGYADGSGFHHYAGSMGAMTTLHMARPDKNIYFTEQVLTEPPESEEIAIASRVKRMIIDVSRNWSKNVILWNLAADPLNDPHTDNGGCSMCQGAISIDGDEVRRFIAYYTIAHASKFVRPGSVRIASTNTGDRTVELTQDEQRQMIKRATVIEDTPVLPNVAFKTPGGRIVLIVANDTYDTRSFQIQYNGKYATIRLEPGAAGTYIW
ncbi:MAG: glycoside hydrolase family 30 beta sandwich domain-containing protein [Bacteroidota bacterium]